MPSIAACRVLTQSGWSGPATVQVADGVIAAIEPGSSAANRLSLVPGFVDLQVNGIDDIDVHRAAGADWTRLGNLLLDQGVTAWCPTLVSAPMARYASALDRIADAQQDAPAARLPTIIGAHLEGPFLGAALGAHPGELVVGADLDWLRALPPVVRLVTIAPEADRAVAAIELLTAREVVVSLGHSRPSDAETTAAIGAGASMVTHVFNAMSGVHHRDYGLATTALVDDRLAVGLIADLVHVNAAAIQLVFRAKPEGGVVLVTDAVGWRAGTAGTIGITMRGGAPRLADGTLAGSALTMDYAIRNVVRHGGIGLDVAIGAAATNPAHVMRRSDLGVIAPGRRADLVALDDDLQVAGVWLGGERVR